MQKLINVNPKVNNDDDGKDDVRDGNKKYTFVCPSNCIIKNTLITTKTRISEVVLSLSYRWTVNIDSRIISRQNNKQTNLCFNRWCWIFDHLYICDDKYNLNGFKRINVCKQFTRLSRIFFYPTIALRSYMETLIMQTCIMFWNFFIP